jgi:hypothetical protein
MFARLLLFVAGVKSGYTYGQNSAHPDQLARSESHSRDVDLDLVAQRLGEFDQASWSEGEDFSHRQAAPPQLGFERKRQLAVVRDLFM